MNPDTFLQKKAVINHVEVDEMTEARSLKLEVEKLRS